MRHAPRRQPKQKRSIAMAEAILEAAARVLAEDGAAGFTTNRVAERAGASIGSLYQFYRDKDAIAAALLRRERDAIRAAMEAAVAGAEGLEAEGAAHAISDSVIIPAMRDPRMRAALERLKADLGLADETIAFFEGLAQTALPLARRAAPEADEALVFEALCGVRSVIVAASARMPQDEPAVLEEIRAQCRDRGRMVLKTLLRAG